MGATDTGRRSAPSAGGAGCAATADCGIAPGCTTRAGKTPGAAAVPEAVVVTTAGDEAVGALAVLGTASDHAVLWYDAEAVVGNVAGSLLACVSVGVASVGVGCNGALAAAAPALG